MFFTTVAQAQSSYVPQAEIQMTAMGSIIYPGAGIAFHQPYKYKEIQRVSGSSAHSVFKEKYWGLHTSFYTQPNYHTNVMLRADWVSARQSPSGVFFETTVGAGLSKTFLRGEVYTVDPNMVVSEKPGGGNLYGLINVGRAMGYNFGRKTEQPLKIFVKANLLILFPYQKFLYLRPVGEIGVAYSLGTIINSNPQKTIVTKKATALRSSVQPKRR